jgi:hypothetical protein
MAESAQTGAWGVLFVQQELLSEGVDSAQMTTDSGVDLVAYDAKSKESFTIQVKTRAGAPSERRPDWKIKKKKRDDADLFAFVLKKKEGGDCWYLSREEVKHRGGLLKLQNEDCALTFYRDKAPRGALTASEMGQFLGKPGLERFLASLPRRRRAQ